MRIVMSILIALSVLAGVGALLVFAASFAVLVHFASAQPPPRQQLQPRARVGGGAFRPNQRAAQQPPLASNSDSNSNSQPRGQSPQSPLSTSASASAPQPQPQAPSRERLSMSQLCAARLCTCRAPVGLYVCHASPRLRLRRVPADIPATAKRLYATSHILLLEAICTCTSIRKS